jgi:hypothetical protein
VFGERGIDCKEREDQLYRLTNTNQKTNSTLTISSLKELRKAHRNNMTRSWMLGGAMENLCPQTI